MKDRVNHPAHYGGADNPFEHIKVCIAMGWGYCIGNATKYLWRAGRKAGSDVIEDLAKAEFYIKHERERLERERDDARHVGATAGGGRRGPFGRAVPFRVARHDNVRKRVRRKR